MGWERKREEGKEKRGGEGGEERPVMILDTAFRGSQKESRKCLPCFILQPSGF